MRQGNNSTIEATFGADMVEWSRTLDNKAKRLVLQCINGVSSNPVEGRTKMLQLKHLILTLVGLIFRRIYICVCVCVCVCVTNDHGSICTVSRKHFPVFMHDLSPM